MGKKKNPKPSLEINIEQLNLNKVPKSYKDKRKRAESVRN